MTTFLTGVRPYVAGQYSLHWLPSESFADLPV